MLRGTTATAGAASLLAANHQLPGKFAWRSVSQQVLPHFCIMMVVMLLFVSR